MNDDRLAGWRETPVKRSIMEFVAAVSDPDSADFVPERERVRLGRSGQAHPLGRHDRGVRRLVPAVAGVGPASGHRAGEVYEAGCVAQQADALITLGSVLAYLGDGSDELTALRDGLKLAERHGLHGVACPRSRHATSCWS